MANPIRPPARRGPSGAWNRLKPMPMDPLDAYGLPSKGETRLHDYKAQEAYFREIKGRYMKFCASAGGREGLEAALSSLNTIKAPIPLPGPPKITSSTSTQERPQLPHRPASATDRAPNDLPNILLAMRKLRESILATRRTDNFAQRAYMFIIHASILTKSWESYLPALHYLLHKIHPHTPLSEPEIQEFSGYQILDLCCRQNELLDAFAVKVRFRQRDRRVNSVLKALVRDDWVRFWRLRRVVDGYQRAVLEFAVERMRLHALKCLGRGYMQAEKAYVERCGDSEWSELVRNGCGWQLQESGIVMIRKLKAK
ncbi:uncharacterized protein MYCFIDRAFT_87586 [Pseudocercospora fijiensis CIRAD86]|uniref:CSN8/PSMD8/EIF3K domain-containing protein n=1 Tax=Pseudocercospora fijiensis (strain CIRAD86) TaxID=383855 RepID=N1QC34_PSEFD|nr:uncharacterized protein MYCFIDRAFT_87586 [Pseudocercospora fijiensis CIRAD86]EME88843.1 hypothetical protein MYCFIDRAFT_87586 [Pseudocercospora fijiensis CIRAD86]